MYTLEKQPLGGVPKNRCSYFPAYIQIDMNTFILLEQISQEVNNLEKLNFYLKEQASSSRKFVYKEAATERWS